jgi:hypothetical protein
VGKVSFIHESVKLLFCYILYCVPIQCQLAGYSLAVCYSYLESIGLRVNSFNTVLSQSLVEGAIRRATEKLLDLSFEI